MAQIDLYTDVAAQEEIESHLNEVFSSIYDQEAKVTLSHKEPVQKKYQKNSVAWKVYLNVEKRKDARAADITCFLRKHKDLDKNYMWNRKLHAAIYKAFRDDEDSRKKEKEKHKFTHNVPEQQRYVWTFPKPLEWDYKKEEINPFFEKNRLSLVEFLNETPFDARFKGEKKINFWPLLPALDPLVILMERLPWFKEKEKMLKGLEKLKIDDYTKNFFEIVDSSITPKDAKSEIKENFKNLVKKYIMDERHETIIQHNGYPKSNNDTYLLNLEKLCYGSRAYQFGAIFGHPCIFNKVDEPEKNISICLVDTYLKFKRNTCYDEYGMGTPKPIDKDEIKEYEALLDSGFYVGSACANSDFFVEYKELLSNDEKKEFLGTIKSQLSILSGRKIKEAEEISKDYNPEIPDP